VWKELRSQPVESLPEKKSLLQVECSGLKSSQAAALA